MKNSWGGRSQRKYKNTKVKWEGKTFDSETELQCYLNLRDREQRLEICDLMLKPGFPIEVDGIKIFERPFHPDFAYRLTSCPNAQCRLRTPIDLTYRFRAFLERLKGPVGFDPDQAWCPQCCVVADYKGYMDPGDSATKIFNIHCKLMRAIYGIEIKVIQTEVTKRRQEKRKQRKSSDRALIRKAQREGRLLS